jgi:type IV secretory pathway VirJ component
MQRRPWQVLTFAAALLIAAAWAGPGLDDRFRGLPITATPAARPGDTLVILYSGDGGWAAIDRGMTAAFNAGGYGVVGLDSRAYFRTPRSAQAAAADLAAMADHYGAAWGAHRVILVGYSFGADALPAIVPALPAATRGQIRLLALVSLLKEGELWFHPSDWLDMAGPDAYPTEPAITALQGLRKVCVYGAADRREACHGMAPGVISQVRLPGDHHFNKAYGVVARAILSAAG